jgi:hypothetical protein
MRVITLLDANSLDIIDQKLLTAKNAEKSR